MSWGNMFYSPVSHVQHSKYVYLSTFAGIEGEEDRLMPRKLAILSKILMGNMQVLEQLRRLPY